MSAGRFLHEEGLACLLEIGDRAVGVGEGVLQMGDGLCLGRGSGVGRHVGWRAALRERRANVALTKSEAFVDALEGAVAEPAVEGAAGGGDAGFERAQEEAPQAVGGQLKPSDNVGAPEAKRASAAVSGVAVAAEDAVGADGCALAGLVVAA